MNSKQFPNQETLLAFVSMANDMADGARKIAQQYFRKDSRKWTKPDSTPVTEADLKIEQYIRNLVSIHYPDHGFIGEEDGTTNNHSQFRWCVDPIDGTKSFVYGVPTFGTLISLTYESVPIVGVIEHPALNERWCGATGIETTTQGEKCRCNNHVALEESVVYATSIDMFSSEELVHFNNVTSLAKRRQFGVDCYAYSLLASGHIDVVMEADMKPFDMMALVPVIEGAGGIVSDWAGKSLSLNSGTQILAAANKHLHQQCIDAIEL